MIAFDLNCGNGHQFEGWFSSSADFEAQRANGMLSCPHCNDPIVRKSLSVPNVPRKGNQRSMAFSQNQATETGTELAESTGNDIGAPAVAELMQKLARAQMDMLDKSQWVGGHFAETARAIHYGEEQDRLIHGETSTDEAKALVDEGISLAPLLFPVIPPSAKN